MKTLGDRIRELREQNDLSLREWLRNLVCQPHSFLTSNLADVTPPMSA